MAFRLSARREQTLTPSKTGAGRPCRPFPSPPGSRVAAPAHGELSQSWRRRAASVGRWRSSGPLVGTLTLWMTASRGWPTGSVADNCTWAYGSAGAVAPPPGEQLLDGECGLVVCGCDLDHSQVWLCHVCFGDGPGLQQAVVVSQYCSLLRSDAGAVVAVAYFSGDVERESAGVGLRMSARWWRVRNLAPAGRNSDRGWAPDVPGGRLLRARPAGRGAGGGSCRTPSGCARVRARERDSCPG